MIGWNINPELKIVDNKSALIRDIKELKFKMAAFEETEELSITISLEYLETITGQKTFLQVPENPDKLLGMEVIPTAYRGIIAVGIKR